MNQMTFKLLSNPNVLVLNCVHLDAFSLKQQQDFQAEMSS